MALNLSKNFSAESSIEGNKNKQSTLKGPKITKIYRKKIIRLKLTTNQG